MNVSPVCLPVIGSGATAHEPARRRARRPAVTPDWAWPRPVPACYALMHMQCIVDSQRWRGGFGAGTSSIPHSSSRPRQSSSGRCSGQSLTRPHRSRSRFGRSDRIGPQAPAEIIRGVAYSSGCSGVGSRQLADGPCSWRADGRADRLTAWSATFLPPQPTSAHHHSRRRDCHLMAPPCTCSRCFNRDKQGVSVK